MKAFVLFIIVATILFNTGCAPYWYSVGTTIIPYEVPSGQETHNPEVEWRYGRATFIRKNIELPGAKMQFFLDEQVAELGVFSTFRPADSVPERFNTKVTQLSAQDQDYFSLTLTIVITLQETDSGYEFDPKHLFVTAGGKKIRGELRSPDETYDSRVAPFSVYIISEKRFLAKFTLPRGIGYSSVNVDFRNALISPHLPTAPIISFKRIGFFGPTS